MTYQVQPMRLYGGGLQRLEDDVWLLDVLSSQLLTSPNFVVAEHRAGHQREEPTTERPLLNKKWSASSSS